ncbi:hypothetical protein ACE1ET_09715 [Saccharicrinis sp. FJH62]|uniref:hypothetical protein n=1 Tax=Saccharicrinis sp. FJH62 TaxID=3344657 RepID=UPI0035D4DEFA
MDTIFSDNYDYKAIIKPLGCSFGGCFDTEYYEQHEDSLLSRFPEINKQFIVLLKSGKDGLYENIKQVEIDPSDVYLLGNIYATSYFITNNAKYFVVEKIMNHGAHLNIVWYVFETNGAKAKLCSVNNGDFSFMLQNLISVMPYDQKRFSQDYNLKYNKNENLPFKLQTMVKNEMTFKVKFYDSQKKRYIKRKAVIHFEDF